MGSRVERIITFLGIGPYSRVTYRWKDRPRKPVQTELFPLAVSEWFPEAEVYVLLTREARYGRGKQWWQQLRSELTGRGRRVKAVPIPSGKREADLWPLFVKMVDAMNCGSLVLDVTHAFRSIPQLSLLAVAFAREVFQCHVEAILYGAYDARKPFRPRPEPTDVVPVFDLTDFADLWTWIAAAHSFVTTGSALEIAARLQGANVPDAIARLRQQLQDISTCLELCRPDDVRYLVPRLDRAIAGAQAKSIPSRYKPMAVLMGAVKRAYDPLRAAGSGEAISQLDSDYAQVGWLLERGQIVQALALAREWLVTWACWWLGLDHGCQEERYLATAALENPKRLQKALRKAQGGNVSLGKFTYPAAQVEAVLQSISSKGMPQEWMEAWRKVKELRNEVAHCAMGRDTGTSQSVQKARKIAESAGKVPMVLDKLRWWLASKPAGTATKQP